ncbi:MotA/TolQ/ExbB proton channel family protein [Paludibacter propionicigenes]|nr:MotA/TolQ/ExbB proton channel family protein [Paludibacter propionicigenes]
MMNLLSIILQIPTDSIANAAASASAAVSQQNYFLLLLKGGWVLLPLSVLFVMSNYVFIERWVSINILGKVDATWVARVNEMVAEGKIDKAIKFCNERQTVYAKVLAAGLESAHGEDIEVQDALQSEARQQISILEKSMNVLGISASIAPMMGFLGTIFGVIKIFYNISVTNDLNIANISDGLYQKMISSGAGLFVGIIAYAGYYILNGRIDKVVVRIDKYSNDLLKEIRNYKRGIKA